MEGKTGTPRVGGGRILECIEEVGVAAVGVAGGEAAGRLTSDNEGEDESDEAVDPRDDCGTTSG